MTWGWLLVGLHGHPRSRCAWPRSPPPIPTAGGLYYWASKLGSPGWGWATGWFNLIGQIAVTAAIGYGLAMFAQALFDYWFDYSAHMNDWFGASFNFSTYTLYAAFLLAAVLINMFNIRFTSGLNMISAWWHMVGVVIVVGILIIVPDHHQSLSYVFTETVNNYRLRRRHDRLRSTAFWFVFGLGPADGPVHDHRLRRVGAHGRGDAQGVAHGGGRDVHVRRRLGRLRLHPARRRHLRDPEHAGRADDNTPADRAVHLGRRR